MQHQLQAPALVRSWPPRHSQQIARGGPRHKGGGDTVGPDGYEKGWCQPRLAGEETGEQRLRGSATPTVSVACPHPTDTRKAPTIVGKGRAAPPTPSLPHPRPTGSSQAPTAVDYGSTTIPATSVPCHGPTSNGKQHAAVDKGSSATATVSVPRPHATANQKGPTALGKGRAAPPILSLPFQVPHAAQRQPQPWTDGAPQYLPSLYHVMVP